MAVAEDTNALLDHIALKRVKVLGWSDGAIIDFLLTIRHPDKVAMGANLQPDAAYPWAMDGIVRVRNRITAKPASGGDRKALYHDRSQDVRFFSQTTRDPWCPAVANVGTGS